MANSIQKFNPGIIVGKKIMLEMVCTDRGDVLSYKDMHGNEWKFVKAMLGLCVYHLFYADALKTYMLVRHNKGEMAFLEEADTVAFQKRVTNEVEKHQYTINPSYSERDIKLIYG